MADPIVNVSFPERLHKKLRIRGIQEERSGLAILGDAFEIYYAAVFAEVEPAPIAATVELLKQYGRFLGLRPHTEAHKTVADIINATLKERVDAVSVSEQKRKRTKRSA